MPALLVCAVIFVASSLPASSLPKTMLFPGQDKVEHGLVYGLLGFLVARACRLRAPRAWLSATPRRWILAGVGFAFLFGVSDELHQSFVPGRSVEGLDLLADTVGGLLGAIAQRIHARAVRAKGPQPLRPDQ